MNLLCKSALISTALIATVFSATAQQKSGPVLTVADYQHAESFMPYNTAALVDRLKVQPHWLPGGRFWYRILTAQGSEFVVVDPVKETKTAAFDQQKLASSLSAAFNKTYDGQHLPFTDFDFVENGTAITFGAGKKNWKCNLQTYGCAEDLSVKEPAKPLANAVLSPDGKYAAFIRNYNLWVHNTSTNTETQLTTDGMKDFGYATDNAGWTKSDRPILTWSPDSKKIATFQQDQRNVSDMYLVTTNVGKPQLQQWKYPLPGDSAVAMLHRVIINVTNPQVIRLQIPPDPHRATLSDDIASGGEGLDDVDWSADGSQLAFVSTSRDHKVEKMRIANANTGEVREVFTESSATQFESGQGKINWRYLPSTNEIIWYSERDNWGHLYLIDARSGKIKNLITTGDYVVTQLMNVDTKNRTVYFLANGYQSNENPYYTHLYKVGFDGKNFIALTPETGNHQISFSADNKFFVDAYSQPDVPPVTLVAQCRWKDNYAPRKGGCFAACCNWLEATNAHKSKG